MFEITLELESDNFGGRSERLMRTLGIGMSYGVGTKYRSDRTDSNQANRYRYPDTTLPCAKLFKETVCSEHIGERFHIGESMVLRSRLDSERGGSCGSA